MKWLGVALLILLSWGVVVNFVRASGKGLYKNNPLLGVIIGTIPLILLFAAYKIAF